MDKIGHFLQFSSIAIKATFDVIFIHMDEIYEYKGSIYHLLKKPKIMIKMKLKFRFNDMSLSFLWQFPPLQ